MNRRLMKAAAVAGFALATVAGAALAAESEDLSEHTAGDKKSGYVYADHTTRAMQDDDFMNPSFLLVDTAAEMWEQRVGEAGNSCADCHGTVEKGMQGVALKYPMIDEETLDQDEKKLINLELRINRCRTKRMKASEWKYESEQMLGMVALITMQSRGMAMEARTGGLYEPFLEKGKKFYYTRRGQLDMACYHCHELNEGNKIRAETLSQGQINGFPTYRLKWQGVGSLHRRFKGCNDNIRAEPYKRGSDEYLALELYMHQRGQGLPIEGPSVRK